MTQTLSTVVKNYTAVLKDWRHIPIDLLDKQAIEVCKENGRFSAFVQIWSGTKKFNGEVSQIIEIVEIRSQSQKWKGYHCDFGCWHSLDENCKCSQKYQMSPMSFQFKIFQKFPQIQYNSQITEKMRQEIIS